MSREEDEYHDIDLKSDDSHDSELFGPRDPNAEHQNILSSPEVEPETPQGLEQPIDLAIGPAFTQEDINSGNNGDAHDDATQPVRTDTPLESEEAVETPAAPLDADDAQQVATPNPLLPPIGDNAPDPSWQDLMNMDWGPLNDEDGDMDFEAARRRSAQDSTIAEEESRGFYYEERPPPSLLVHELKDEHFIRWTARLQRGWDGSLDHFENRTRKKGRPTTNDDESPLRTVRSVEDLSPVSSDGQKSPEEEEWEAFVENVSNPSETSSDELDRAFKEEFEAQQAEEDAQRAAELAPEALVVVDEADSNPEAELQDDAEDRAGHFEATSRPNLRISTSDGILHRPIAVRPSSRTSPSAEEPAESDPTDNEPTKDEPATSDPFADPPLDEQPATDSPRTPPSAEMLHAMTGLNPNESSDLLQQTYKELQKTNFEDPTLTLGFKRKLIFYYKDRLQYNGFDERYIKQILAERGAEKIRDPQIRQILEERGSGEASLAEMFNTAAPFFYREQRDEYRRWGEDLDDRRLDLEFKLGRAVQREDEAYQEIGMLKHQVDKQERKIEAYEQAFDRQAEKAKEEFDRANGLLEEEEEDAEDAEDAESGTKGAEAEPKAESEDSEDEEISATRYTYVSQDTGTQTEKAGECECHEHYSGDKDDEEDESCPEKLARLQEDYEELRLNRNSFREENQNFRSLNDELKMKLWKSLQSNNNSNRKRSNDSEDDDECPKKLAKLQKEYDALDSKETALRKENDSLHGQIIELEDRLIAHLDCTCSEQQPKGDNADDADGKDKGKKKEEEDSCPRKLAKLQKAYDDLLKTARSYRTDWQQVKALNAAADKKLEEAKRVYTHPVFVPGSSEDGERLWLEWRNLEDTNTMLWNNNQALEGEKGALKDDNGALGESHAALEKEVQRLEEENEKLKGMVEEFREWRDEQRVIEESVINASHNGAAASQPSSSSAGGSLLRTEEPAAPQTSSGLGAQPSSPVGGVTPSTSQQPLLSPPQLPESSWQSFAPSPPRTLGSPPTHPRSPSLLPPLSPRPSNDLSQYFMSIDPRSPPPPPLFPISREQQEFEDQIRQTDAYVQRRAQILRQMKVWYDNSVAAWQNEMEGDVPTESPERRAMVERIRAESRERKEKEARERLAAAPAL